MKKRPYLGTLYLMVYNIGKKCKYSWGSNECWMKHWYSHLGQWEIRIIIITVYAFIQSKRNQNRKVKITIAFISIHRVGFVKIEAVKNKLALTNSTDLAKVNNLMLNIWY